MDHSQETLPPHVLIFPLPAQGHVNSMLKLAELLCLAGVHVTFLVSDHIHDRLLRHTDVHKRFEHYCQFRFQRISDGFPVESSRSGSDFLTELVDSLTVVKPLFRDLFVRSNRLSSKLNRPVTCIIADGVLSFAIDVAEEMGIPIIYFRTISACAFWAYFCIPQLIESGELPFKGNDLDVPIQSIPGMEAFLRRRDLPGICRVGDSSNHGLQFLSIETRATPRARAVILNTFEDLEGPILSHIRTQMPNVYTIGPLHAHLKTRLVATAPLTVPTSSNSIWEEDRSCMTWLDAQPSQSVIYVSFGSLTIITRPQLMEFWHGLVNSGKRFLWVIRPDLVTGGDAEGQIPTELLETTKERGYIVGWAPQEDVLNHEAIGSFLTHSGWNSTLESIIAGVPMICWPYFIDQQVNSRFVGEVWRLGMDIKDTCDRVIVETMIRDLMEVRKSDFVHSANRMAELARNAIGEGGSSYCNLDRLIEDLKLMSVQSRT
ncbi:7-deoxyloganetic acid glucosyl transferase [Camellia lanceoleosa]|uniref:7-deoxyloganetic acid glucosyl transferase n=1 Tax=Camellia lanceoleosa TaxID=1840588 RepID=A0ACC0IWB8_9ERIC|nr:7-deoxyloganetic acid glucosyl transferase [Camellia lanceoleosa]